MLFEDVSLQKKQGEISNDNLKKTPAKVTPRKKIANKERFTRNQLLKKSILNVDNERKTLAQDSQNIAVNDPKRNLEEKDSSEK